MLGVKNEILDLSLIASLTGLAANVVALADGSKVADKKRQDIEKSFIDLSGKILKYTLNTYGLADKVLNVEFQASSPLTSPFGPVNAGIAALTGVVTGVDQFFSSNEKYKSDGLATATQNAWIDAFSTGIYEAAHKYTFGADDAVFEGVRWLAYNLTGKGDQYTESDLNYMEWDWNCGENFFVGRSSRK